MQQVLQRSCRYRVTPTSTLDDADDPLAVIDLQYHVIYDERVIGQRWFFIEYGRWCDVCASDENVESVAFTLGWFNDMLNETIALQ